MTSKYQTIYSVFEATMLQDADDAITSCGLWEWLRDYNPEEGKGFAFSTDPNLDRISNAMKYQGHSGSSWAWTMRTMQQVARIGWDKYVQLASTENPPCPCRRAKGHWGGWCGVAGGGVPACEH